MTEEITRAAKAVELMLGTDQEQLAEEKICIVRDTVTGEIAWRFKTAGDPHTLMLWTLFYSMMTDSGYRKRIETLERQVAQLTMEDPS